jgi:HKD family nuclease
MSATNSRLDLHAALDSDPFTQAVILTYTFEPAFFEKYCLVNLRALSTCQSVTICLDRATYENVLDAPAADRSRHVNVRYLLHPVDVPGVFHPKMILLTSENRARLIIGSANFTRPGLTSNAELAAVYDFRKKEREEFGSLFQSAFQFLWHISERWPSRNLRSNLQEIARQSEWIVDPSLEPGPARLLTNIEKPLLEQLAALSTGQIQSVSVVAPYFDESPALMEKILSIIPAHKLKIYTQNGRTTLSADWLRHEFVKKGKVEVYLTDYSEGELSQPLHGKLFALESSSSTTIAFGSANCTTSALLRTAKHGNLECLIACTLSPPQVRKSISRLLDPENRAERVIDPWVLVTATGDDIESRTTSTLIQIEEAEIEKEKIVVWLSKGSLELPQRAKLEFSGGKYLHLPLKTATRASLIIGISEALERRTAREAVVLSLENSAGKQISNRVFVINLQDDATGLSVRKARHVKDAEQNALGLLAVLHDLRSGLDEEALRTFLIYCSIPLVLGPRSKWRSLARDNSKADSGMRGFGPRNFDVVLSLHQLVLDFCERHFKKLQRLAWERRVESIVNFLHISLAIAGILDAQIDRALAGLEAKILVSPDEWYHFREVCDAYLHRYQDLNKLLWNDYLNKLILRYPKRLSQIRAAFGPELRPLQALSSNILNYRKRVEDLRVTKCLLPVRQGVAPTPFRYFNSIFDVPNWARFAAAVRVIDAQLTELAPRVPQ